MAEPLVTREQAEAIVLVMHGRLWRLLHWRSGRAIRRALAAHYTPATIDEMQDRIDRMRTAMERRSRG